MRLIQEFQKRNGGWGMNHGFIARDRGGFVVGLADGRDPFFVPSWPDAKAMYLRVRPECDETKGFQAAQRFFTAKAEIDEREA